MEFSFCVFNFVINLFGNEVVMMLGREKGFSGVVCGFFFEWLGVVGLGL